jgi:hypothetical protein
MSEERLRRTEGGCRERCRSPDLCAPMLNSAPACVIRITVFETHRLPLPDIGSPRSPIRRPLSFVRRPSSG